MNDSKASREYFAPRIEFHVIQQACALCASPNSITTDSYDPWKNSNYNYDEQDL